MARLPSLRTLFARTAEPYAGSDIALARRAALAMWSLCSLVVVVLEVFYPPTHTLGNAGWAVFGAEVLIAFGIIRMLADKRRAVGYDFLYVIGFIGVLLLGLSEYGAGGRVAPFHELNMFLLLGTALMHPPHRVFTFLAVLAAATFAPAIYAPRSADVGEGSWRAWTPSPGSATGVPSTRRSMPSCPARDAPPSRSA